MSRTLDDLLNEARLFFPEDTDEDDQAAYRRVVADYVDATERDVGGGYPNPALDLASLAASGPPVSPRREEAARELRALSSLTVRAPQAAERIADMATSHQIDPDSAFTFACLLHLADRDEQAEFLWQFSAGAGKPASAECLHLLHTIRGELREARHWAAQAAELDTIGGHKDPADLFPAIPLTGARPLPSLMLLRIWHALRHQEPGTGTRLTMAAFHACAGTLSRAMTLTIQDLKPEPGEDDDGLLPWPDGRLAAQMHSCLA
ncbi:hypothetical protein [Streptomyces sp. WMMB303]|uniref:hypothetical protein n=1 Tax=Streptomyces sp. WMMB303 TaxID=3034154 RepID=UPI0023EC470F|nr:hypothetical protein [Streptomyces sp. WMMB303]MDF4254604.1 hypothetical protein [Streptomyces sp. WMMB303]